MSAKDDDGYTPMSPEPSPVKKEKSQQPEDSDDEDILTSVCPNGLADDSIKTFVFKNQGHTLGNVLKDQLLKYPEINFCGYSIPHPGEHVMHLRVQTQPGSGISAGDMLKRGLEDIVSMCDHLEEIFSTEWAKTPVEPEEPPLDLDS